MMTHVWYIILPESTVQQALYVAWIKCVQFIAHRPRCEMSTPRAYPQHMKKKKDVHATREETGRVANEIKAALSLSDA